MEFTDRLAKMMFDGKRADAIKYIAIYGHPNDCRKCVPEWGPHEIVYAHICIREYYAKWLRPEDIEYLVEVGENYSFSPGDIEYFQKKYGAVKDKERLGAYKKSDALPNDSKQPSKKGNRPPPYESFDNSSKSYDYLFVAFKITLPVALILSFITYKLGGGLLFTAFVFIMVNFPAGLVMTFMKDSASYIIIKENTLRGRSIHGHEFSITYDDIDMVDMEKRMIVIYHGNKNYYIRTRKHTKKVYDIITKQLAAYDK